MSPRGYRTGEVRSLEFGERGFEAQVWSLGCAVPGGVSIQLRTELSLANEDNQYVWSLFHFSEDTEKIRRARTCRWLFKPASLVEKRFFSIAKNQRYGITLGMERLKRDGDHTMLEGRHQGVKAAMAEMCFRAQAGTLDSLAAGNRNQL